MIRSRLRILSAACMLVTFAAVAPAAARAFEVVQDTIPLGSTRNSVAAIPAADLPDELIYLTSGMSEAMLASIQAVAPNIRIIDGLDRESAIEHAGQAHGVDAHLLSSAFLDAAPDLRWAQSGSAGVDRYITIPELMSRDEIVLTNMKGMYGPVIAEHVFAMMLTRARNLPHYLDAGRRGEWDRSGAGAMGSLQGGTMLVVGRGQSRPPPFRKYVCALVLSMWSTTALPLIFGMKRGKKCSTVCVSSLLMEHFNKCLSQGV